MCESCRKLDLRFLSNKIDTFYVLVTHLILRLAIVQNKFQQANKTKINHINDNHVSSLRFLYIFGGSRLLCAPRSPPFPLAPTALDVVVSEGAKLCAGEE